MVIMKGLAWPVPFPGTGGPPPPPPPPPQAVYLGGLGTSGVPVNSITLPITCTQNKLLVLVSWAVEPLFGNVTCGPGAPGTPFPMTSAGDHLMGGITSEFCWFEVPSIPGGTTVTARFQGIDTGYLAMTIYEWSLYTATLRHQAAQVGPLAPEEIAAWPVDNNVPQLYLPGCLSLNGGPSATPFDAPYAAPIHQQSMSGFGQNFWHQSTFVVQTVGGVWTPKKSPINQDMDWHINILGVQ